jgi:hypothetical protein
LFDDDDDRESDKGVVVIVVNAMAGWSTSRTSDSIIGHIIIIIKPTEPTSEEKDVDVAVLILFSSSSPGVFSAFFSNK